jgi:hypothetical protein
VRDTPGWDEAFRLYFFKVHCDGTKTGASAPCCSFLCFTMAMIPFANSFSIQLFQCVHVYPHSVEVFPPVAQEAYAPFSHLHLQEWAAFL